MPSSTDSPITLREAALRTARSVTTLRRYIRSGRLRADKRPGRFGPEFFVSEQSLAAAGLSPGVALPPSHPDGRALSGDRAGGDYVPLGLYQELQMKHEQLLVQYGMIRAGGLRVIELRAELEATGLELERERAEHARLRREYATELSRLRQRLRESELEQQGASLEARALEEKVRALEMVRRNAAMSSTIDEQFDETFAQHRRVRRAAARLDGSAPGTTGPDAEH